MVEKKLKTSQDKDYRFERKFQLDKPMLELFNYWFAKQNFGFKSPYPDRHVNNVYYDSNSFSSFMDAEAGISNKVKVRTRWYGEFNKIKSPTLELKHKTGFVNYKDSFTLEDKEYNLKDLLKVRELTGELPSEFKIFLYKYNQAVLINSYHRQYFENRNGIRLTIDTGIKYRNPILKNGFTSCDNFAILEIKYKKEMKDIALPILKSLPFRLDKNSKFANGLEKIWNI